MTDIVEQFLKNISEADFDGKLVLRGKFADLIVKERMTADNVIELFHAENKRLRAENERLREALKPFSLYVKEKTKTYEYEGIQMALIDHDKLMWACIAARKALGETE